MISIDISKMVGEAFARILEERDLVLMPVDTANAVLVIGEAAAGSVDEAEAIANLRALLQRDRERAADAT